MKGHTAFQIHQALNLHFNDSANYDAVKYNFITRNNSLKYFNKNKNKWQYIWVEDKTRDLLYSMLCAFCANDFKFLQFNTLLKCIKKTCNDIRTTFLEETFKNDLLFLEGVYYNDKSEIFSDGELYPKLYEHYKQGDIHLFTVILIDNYIKKFIVNEVSKDIIVWPKFVTHASKVSKILTSMFDRTAVDKQFRVYYLGQSV